MKQTVLNISTDVKREHQQSIVEKWQRLCFVCDFIDKIFTFSKKELVIEIFQLVWNLEFSCLNKLNINSKKFKNCNVFGFVIYICINFIFEKSCL